MIMAKKKEEKKPAFDMGAECTPDGVPIRHPDGYLTREFRVKYPELSKQDDDKRRKGD